MYELISYSLLVLLFRNEHFFWKTYVIFENIKLKCFALFIMFDEVSNWLINSLNVNVNCCLLKPLTVKQPVRELEVCCFSTKISDDVFIIESKEKTLGFLLNNTNNEETGYTVVFVY